MSGFGLPQSPAGTLDRIKQTTDVQTLIGYAYNPTYFGFYDPEEQHAIKERLKEVSGLDPANYTSADEFRINLTGQKEKKEIEKESNQQKGEYTKFIAGQRKEINNFADEYRTNASSYRDKLAERLASLNNESFSRMRPDLYEELNSKGLLSSETALSTSLANAAKDLELDRQTRLLDFDTGAFNTEQDIRSGGLNTYLTGMDEATKMGFSGRNTALEAAINARRAGLERNFSLADANAAQAAQDAYARRARRTAITNALIQGGATALTAAIPGGAPFAPAVSAATGSLLDAYRSPSYEYAPDNFTRSPGSTLGPLDLRTGYGYRSR